MNQTPNCARGFSLVEILIVTGVMGVMMLAMMTMQSNQMKSNNYLEFQLKRTQLEGTLLGQFLSDPKNCACLFAGANNFPVAGTTALTGSNPTRIGLFSSPPPGCGAPAQYFVDSVGIDGIKATAIRMRTIVPTINPNTYSGTLQINIQSTKDVLGPKDLLMSIPVSIATTPAGANVAFASCSINAVASTTVFIPSRKTNQCTVASWQSNPFPTCTPGSCSLGQTALDTGCMATGDYGGWTTYSCVRNCYTGTLPSGFVYDYYCPYRTSGNNTFGAVQCTPTPCPSGTTQKDLSCESTYTGSGYMKGFCRRTCAVN